MSKRFAWLITLALLVTSCGAEGEFAEETSEPVESEIESGEGDMDMNEADMRVDQFFRSFIAENEPGAVVVVVQDGEIVFQAAYGLANREDGTPLTTDHYMHIASMGKQMTSLAIMLLKQDGLLDYDDPVGNHIPKLAHFGDDFTIRKLLTHTSGLADYDDALTNEMLAISETPSNEDMLSVLAQMDSPAYTPGDVYEYSNPGYDLLGLMIERISGQSFPDFMEARIFSLLGMAHTFSLPNEDRRADPLVAISYTDENGGVDAYPNDPLDNLVGSGSVYTTAGDMALYDEAFFAETLLPRSAFDEAFTPVELNDGTTEPYGFGWELEEWNGVSYVAHSGAWLGFESDYVRIIDRHVSVAVMLNRNYNYPDDTRIALKVAELYLGE